MPRELLSARGLESALREFSFGNLVVDCSLAKTHCRRDLWKTHNPSGHDLPAFRSRNIALSIAVRGFGHVSDTKDGGLPAITP
jgi:hypothetical protein